jgi:hypothetical protein
MSLENLKNKGFLINQTASEEEIKRIFRLADRHLSDSLVRGLSADAKLDLAYESIRSFALAALRACDFRPRSVEGSHMVTIDSLKHTIGIDSVAKYHALRNKRHRNVYDQAYSTSLTEAKEAIACAKGLKELVLKWLKVKFPSDYSDIA